MLASMLQMLMSCHRYNPTPTPTPTPHFSAKSAWMKIATLFVSWPNHYAGFMEATKWKWGIYISGVRKRKAVPWGQQMQQGRSASDEPSVAFSKRWPVFSRLAQGRPGCKGRAWKPEICSVRLGTWTHCRESPRRLWSKVKGAFI